MQHHNGYEGGSAPASRNQAPHHEERPVELEHGGNVELKNADGYPNSVEVGSSGLTVLSLSDHVMVTVKRDVHDPGDQSGLLVSDPNKLGSRVTFFYNPSGDNAGQTREVPPGRSETDKESRQRAGSNLRKYLRDEGIELESRIRHSAYSFRTS